MTGYRAFSPMFVKSFPVLSKGFEIETEMTIHALDKNFALASVPVDYRDRPEGSESKLNTFSDGFKVLKTIASLIRDCKPFLFFGVLSALFMAVALIMLLPVLQEYYLTGLVPRMPTFVASCFMAVFSMLSFIAGLILDTLVKFNRQNFELQMNMIRQLLDRSAAGES